MRPWLALALVISPIAPAATCPLYVDAINGDDANSGLSAADPFATYGRALAEIDYAEWCHVYFAAGVYPAPGQVPSGVWLSGAGIDVTYFDVAPGTDAVIYTMAWDPAYPSSSGVDGATFRGPPDGRLIAFRANRYGGAFSFRGIRSEGIGGGSVVAGEPTSSMLRGGFANRESQLVDTSLSVSWVSGRGSSANLVVTFENTLFERGGVHVGLDAYEALGWFAFTNNTFVGGASVDVWITAVSSLELQPVIDNNIFTGGASIDLDSVRTSVRNNALEPGAVVRYLYQPWTTGPELNGNDWASDNLFVDPGLVDRAGGDYHLAPGSACIDAGRAGPVDDFDGDPRPLDGDGDGTATVDIGFDELVRRLRLGRLVLTPPLPPLSTVLPLDPASDPYDPAFPSTRLDPDSAIVDDAGRPLAFYQLGGPGVIRLAVTSERMLQIVF